MKGRQNVQPIVSPTPAGSLVAAAHELKAPLVLMRHLAQSLSTSELKGSLGQQRDYLERLQLTAERSLRLVQQLTLSYRLDTDQLPFAFAVEPLNINKVCAEAVHELLPYAKHHGQQLRVSGGSCPHLVLANRDVLHDIVVNLVDNAIQHNPNGEWVEVGAQCRGEHVRLAVRDSGGGVLPSELTRLKQHIGKQPQPLSGRAGTSGLGLYIVQQFAQAMGGALGVGRATNGTTIFVDLLRSRQLSLL